MIIEVPHIVFCQSTGPRIKEKVVHNNKHFYLLCKSESGVKEIGQQIDK